MVMKKSEATTMMGLERELRDAANSLTRCNPTAISLRAGCELFLRFVTRTAAHSVENEKFDVCKVTNTAWHMGTFSALPAAW